MSGQETLNASQEIAGKQVVGVRITELSNHFLFDTDFQGLKYEVTYSTGETVQKMALWSRDNVTPVDLDLSCPDVFARSLNEVLLASGDQTLDRILAMKPL